tara:strand:- start:5527 stop:7485 length:1959 start_codon:yes stop_codon:yes gene_type:complete
MFSLGRGGLKDPRVDAHKTTAGAAMAMFMKIRTDMNLTVWKMRLKLSDPSSLIKLEMDIQDRIDNRYKMLAELKTKSQAERSKLIKEYRGENVKIYEANLKFVSELSRQESDVIDDAVQISQEYAKQNSDVKSKAFIDGKLNQLDKSVDEYLKTSADVRTGKATADDRRNVVTTIASSWFAGLDGSLRNAISRSTPDGATGEVALERAWLYAYTSPSVKLADRIKEYEDKGKTAEAQDLRRLVANLKFTTNSARFGSGTRLDIHEEHLQDAKDRDYALEEQRGVLTRAYGFMTTAGRVQSPTEINEEVSKALSVGPELDMIKASIPRLEQRLETVSGRRLARQIEQDQLLKGFGGTNLAFAPFATRPSDRGDRMEALNLLGEAEQGLRDTAGIGEVTFPAGEGGNFSQFLKNRIAKYDDKLSASRGDVNSADWSGLGDAMDQVALAYGSFGENLSQSDTKFESSTVGLRNQPVVSIGEVIAEYQNISQSTPEYRDMAAANAFNVISSGNAPVSRNYLKIQRLGTPTEQQEAAYNSVFMPLKTNIAMVLNPKIESLRKARDGDDIDGMVASVQDIYRTVEGMPDDLLGAAGVNIRTAIQDNPAAEDRIGAEPSVFRLSKLIDDQYISMNEQVVRENNQAENIFEEITLQANGG